MRGVITSIVLLFVMASCTSGSNSTGDGRNNDDPCASCSDGSCEGTPCDDGHLCTLDDACNAQGTCAGAFKSCNDNNACTSDACLPDTGACSNLPLNTEECQPDGSLCDNVECDDQNPCTIEDCNPNTGDCVYTQLLSGTSCDDNTACTDLDACNNLGACVGVARDCTDNDQCTTDACANSECTHERLNTPSCQQSTGCANNSECDDHVFCTTDTCVLSTGECTYTPKAETVTCDDGNPCTEHDACNTEGACAGTTKQCNSENACTAGSCNVNTGECTLVDVENGTPCNAGACTTLGTCNSGMCTAGTVSCTTSECQATYACKSKDFSCPSPYLVKTNVAPTTQAVTENQRLYGLNQGEDGCVYNRALNSLEAVVCDNRTLVTREVCDLEFFKTHSSTKPTPVTCGRTDSRFDATFATLRNEDNPVNPDNDDIWCLVDSGNGLLDCEYYGLQPRESKCLNDRYLMTCGSNLEPELARTKYPNASIPKGANEVSGFGNIGFIDCFNGSDGSTLGGGGNGGGIVGQCGNHPVHGDAVCLPRGMHFDDASLDVTNPPAYATDWTIFVSSYEDAVSLPSNSSIESLRKRLFKDTDAGRLLGDQIVVSCGSPSNNFTSPYMQLDTLGQLYTDYDLAIVKAGVQKLHDRGILYAGYANFWGPEMRPGLTWYDAGYQYGYMEQGTINSSGAWSGLGADGFEVIPHSCWDQDYDGISNLLDNCKTVANHDQILHRQNGTYHIGEACWPSTPGSDLNDIDGDGKGNAEDNCPLVSNEGQADGDHNAIGDACDDLINTTCQTELLEANLNSGDGTSASTVVRINHLGSPVYRRDMEWSWDLCQPRWLDAIYKWIDLMYAADLDAFTWDVAYTADCFSAYHIERFKGFLAGIDAADASNPNMQSIAQYKSLLTNIETDINVADYRASLSEEEWNNSAVRTLWEAFQLMRVAEVSDAIKAQSNWKAAGLDRTPIVMFFNNGPRADSMILNAYDDISGLETGMTLNEPVTGVTQGLPFEDGRGWPQVSHEYIYDLHLSTGKRFWNWTIPVLLNDDRTNLYVAETLAGGGIAQTAWCHHASFAPKKGYFAPDLETRMQQGPIFDFADQNKALLSLQRPEPNAAAIKPIGLYWSEGLPQCSGNEDVDLDAARMVYQALRDLHMNVRIIPGGPLAYGPYANANPAQIKPTLLEKYDYIIFPGWSAMSRAEKDAFNAYALLPGKTLYVVQGSGSKDAFCNELSSGNPPWSSEWTPQSKIKELSIIEDDVTYALTKESLRHALTPNRDVRQNRDEAGECVTANNAPCPACDCYEMEDIASVREVIRTRLLTYMTNVPPRYSTTLSPNIHINEYVDANGWPVYHLINYNLEAYDSGETPVYVTTGESRKGPYPHVHFGRSSAQNVSWTNVPLPASIGSTSFTYTVAQVGLPKMLGRSDVPESSSAESGSLNTNTALNITVNNLYQWAIISFKNQ